MELNIINFWNINQITKNILKINQIKRTHYTPLKVGSRKNNMYVTMPLPSEQGGYLGEDPRLSV